MTSAVRRRSRGFNALNKLEGSHNEEEDELLIVAYEGHGECIPPPHVKSDTRTLIWRSEQGRLVGWKGLQHYELFPGERDTLLILDFCFAGAAYRSFGRSREDILGPASGTKLHLTAGMK